MVQSEILIMKVVDQIVDEPSKHIADSVKVLARLNAKIAGLIEANYDSVAVQVLARLTSKMFYANTFSQGAIKVIQQIGTPDDVVREVEKYRAQFGDDEFITSLEIPYD